MAPLLNIFNTVVTIAYWVIFLQVILSWLINFEVLNPRQPLVWSIWNGLNRLLEPVYRPIRRRLPDLGGLDISPLVVLFGLYVLSQLVNGYAPRSYGY